MSAGLGVDDLVYMLQRAQKPLYEQATSGITD